MQLRRVTTTLNNQQYIDSIRGKGGGYRANAHTPTITLDTLYQLFVLDKLPTQRILLVAKKAIVQSLEISQPL